MATNDGVGRAALVVCPFPAELRSLARQIDLTPVERIDIRVWEQSGVERVYLEDGDTAILKYSIGDFAETDVLAHAWAHGLPVPQLLASTTRPDGSVLMLLEDLGPEVRRATLADVATAAVAIDRCPPLPDRPRLDAADLAMLPRKALGSLAWLRENGRWRPEETGDIQHDLEEIEESAASRARGTEIPPFGLSHSEFHPTSIHVGLQGLKILDWARAYTGSRLLDLVSWQGTGDPLDLSKVAELLDAYVAAGGPETAHYYRGGLPAHVWASGWDKMWICEWFLEGAARWADTTMDTSIQGMVSRHLGEAAACLTG